MILSLIRPKQFLVKFFQARPVDLFVADWSVFTPETPGPKEDIWIARQNSSNSGGPFEISPMQQEQIAGDAGNRRAGARGAFATGAVNPSMTLRNLILSPIKRPQLSHGRPNIFT